jgi:hypothetical protein
MLINDGPRLPPCDLKEGSVLSSGTAGTPRGMTSWAVTRTGSRLIASGSANATGREAISAADPAAAMKGFHVILPPVGSPSSMSLPQPASLSAPSPSALPALHWLDVGDGSVMCSWVDNVLEFIAPAYVIAVPNEW